MKPSRVFLLPLCMALLAGCAAPRPSVALQSTQINKTLGRVGLIFNVPPKPDTYFEGVNGSRSKA
jgi:hypothetical protein